MKIRAMKKWQRRLAGFILLLIIFTCISLFWLKHLAISKPVDSAIYVIEGWLPKPELERCLILLDSLQPQLVLTVGYSYLSDGKSNLSFYSDLRKEDSVSFNDWKKTKLWSSGGLVFVFDSALSGFSRKEFTIEAWGSGNFGYNAYFNFAVNDSLIGGYFTRETDSVYAISCSTDTIYSFTVDFDNDYNCSPVSDRNLILTHVFVNDKSINEFSGRIYHFYQRLGNFYPRGIISQAADAEFYLRQLGYDSSPLIPVHSQKVEYNRSLANSIALKDFLIKNYPEITSVNIITTRLHSRRSYLNYKNVLSELKVGVVPTTKQYESCYQTGIFSYPWRVWLDESIDLAGTYWYWIFNRRKYSEASE